MEKKITVQCCVPSCHNTNHMSPQILFFPFPKRREMQEKWLHAIRRPELKKMLPVDKPFHMFICLDHFRQNDVVQINQRTCLRAGVIPSVFKWSDVVVKEEKASNILTPSTSTTPPTTGTTSSSSSSGPKSKSSAISNKIKEATVTINCGQLTAELHRDKFYCPGIHRECIRYNNQFITPKMLMIMGDKEKLKDWKNAIRIGGTKIRKFIESKQLDFHKHKEFCTGRCVARLPVNLFRTRAQPPEEYINTSGDISHVLFADGDAKPEYHRVVGDPVIETEYDEEESDESIVDEKPDLETLNALLKNPIPTAMLTKSPATEHGITDSQMFWRGIAKLGLIDTVFDVVKESISQLRTNFIMHDARPEDAHLLSSVIREMGLSNKIQHMLASSKQNMDDHYNKLEQEMKELQHKVNQYETRKRLLKKRSEEFKAILDMNNPKHSSPSSSDVSFNQNKRGAESNPEENVKRFKISHSEQLKRILQAPQKNSPGGHNTIDDDETPTFVMAKDSLKPGQILKIIPNEAGGQPLIIQKTVGADGSISTKTHESNLPEESTSDVDETLPKILSVESIKQEVIDAPEATTSQSSDDIRTLADIQNVVANGQSLTERILQSTAGEKDKGDGEDDVDDDDIDDDDLMETMEMYGDSQETAMKVIRDPENPNSQLIIYKRSDGKAETFRFSNNSAITQSSDEKTESNQSADEHEGDVHLSTIKKENDLSTNEKMDDNQSSNEKKSDLLTNEKEDDNQPTDEKEDDDQSTNEKGDGNQSTNEKEDDDPSTNEKGDDKEPTNEKLGDQKTNEKGHDNQESDPSTNKMGDGNQPTNQKEGDDEPSNTKDDKSGESEGNPDKDTTLSQLSNSEITNQNSQNDFKIEKESETRPETPKGDKLIAKIVIVDKSKSTPPELKKEAIESTNDNSNSATESEAGSLPPTLLPEESTNTPDTARTRRSSRKRVAKVKDDL